MALAAGTRLGPYEILMPIGAGGMGEVYRARDPRMGRDVAVKLSAERFGDRFEREVHAVSALNHPNICHVYDVGPNYLVMELVEGPTVADLIREGALPLEEALVIARQIADALEAAHEKGIVHRDLKPANIKIKPDGAVKVLDFGLAKMAETAAQAGSPENSPTVGMGATVVGQILGTAAYMAPEQARGKTVDKRADIWAFGAVLYEMLTGKMLFGGGETVADTLSAVIQREPDWTALPRQTPAHIRRLLDRCLRKDTKTRLRDIGEARITIDEMGNMTPEGVSEAPPNLLRRVLPWTIAAIAIVFAAWLLWRDSGTARRQVMHLGISYPRNVEAVSGLQCGFALSPDGRSIAMIGVRDGVRSVYIRRLDRAEAAEINGTGGSNCVAFSPDNGSVVFVPGNGLVTRLSLSDQQRAVVASGADLTGSLAWGPGQIIYTRGGSVWTVPARGGAPRQLTVLDAARHEVEHTDAAVFPGSRTVLFTSLTTEPGTERIEAVSLDGGQRTVVLEHAIGSAWSPSGHLLFGRDGAVWAAPFDPRSATVRGAAVPVIPAGLVGAMRSGSPGLRVTAGGDLVFVPDNFGYSRVVSVGRDGSELALDLPPNDYANPRISPDGRRLLIGSNGNLIETFDLLRGTRARLAMAALGTGYSVWTGDGKGVVFRRFDVPFWQAADGSGQAGPLPKGLINDFPSSAGPDPDSILAVRIQPETSGDIFLMSIRGKFQPKPLLMARAYEGGAQLSPDGRWIVYQSNESGQPEIYVRRYPALDRAWQVSQGGGVQARWSSMSREIYYRGGQRIMAVAFDASAPEPAFGRPATLFTDEYEFGLNISIANYDVTRDGRFIMLRRETRGGLRAVINWTEELRQILAAGGAR